MAGLDLRRLQRLEAYCLSDEESAESLAMRLAGQQLVAQIEALIERNGVSDDRVADAIRLAYGEVDGWQA